MNELFTKIKMHKKCTMTKMHKICTKTRKNVQEKYKDKNAHGASTPYVNIKLQKNVRLRTRDKYLTLNKSAQKVSKTKGHKDKRGTKSKTVPREESRARDPREGSIPPEIDWRDKKKRKAHNFHI